MANKNPILEVDLYAAWSRVEGKWRALQVCHATVRGELLAAREWRKALDDWKAILDAWIRPYLRRRR